VNGKRNKIIPVSELHSGIYIVTIHGEKRKSKFKICQRVTIRKTGLSINPVLCQVILRRRSSSNLKFNSLTKAVI
jgi:hypothetical protein